MKFKKIPSREDQIKLIQKKLADNPPARDFAALTRTLGLLTGAINTYGRKSDQTQPDQKQEQPEPLPSWWSDSWARSFIAERACGSCRAGRWARELDQFEADWAKREGFSSVEGLREAIRREDAEWKAQHSPEERLAMARAHLESLRHPDSAATVQESNNG
jgi:hypothetical protein